MSKLFLFFVSFFIFIQFSIAAEDPGYQIALKAQESNASYAGENSIMKMILIDAHGARTEREMIGKNIDKKGEGDKSIIEFLNPLDVKGTKLLTWSHLSDDDDQWLFLPSLKRVKRITGSGQSASFMGSEFSFEDLGSQDVEKFDYKLLKEEKLGTEDVWVLERRPKKKSSYSKQVLYLSKKLQTPLKIEYYDRKEELLKVATLEGHKQYKASGKNVWRAHMIQMKNVQTQKESVFEWKERQVGIALKDSEFDQNNLN